MSAGDRIARVVRTIRPLRPRQLGAQVLHAARGIGTPAPWAGPAPVLATDRVPVPFLPAPAHARVDPGPRFTLIGREVDMSAGVDWGFAGEGPLFAYHLHQFDHLRADGVDPALRQSLMLDWVRGHPVGVGWDPHPTCLRILSWGKLLLGDGALPGDADARAEIRHSLARQIDWLSRHLEVRLQANHLLSNLIGVVFGGLLFAGPDATAWRAFGDRLIDELRSQVRPDGLHEERSPMYHALLLENLLDLLDLARAPSTDAPGRLVEELERVTARMLGALAVVCHPDDEIALFSDSAFGIAQRPARLRQYADALGVAASPGSDGRTLADSGYVRLEGGPFTLIASVAGPSPAHQPGHAHCDALAFELSCGTERVVTDTGVFEYVPGEPRRIARATASHATIEVAGADQAEVWSAHRVGGRPEVVLEAVEPRVRAVACCRGWSTPDTLHRRVFSVRGDAVEVQDRIEGRRRPVLLVLPLAPALEPRLAHDPDGATEAHVVLGNGSRLRIALPVSASWSIERTPYYPEFGTAIDRSTLVGRSSDFERGTFRFECVE